MYIYAMQSAWDYACLRMYMYIYAMHVHVIMITYAMQSAPN